MTPMVLVGLDVHARQTHATVLNQATGELSTRRLHGLPEEAVLPFLGQLAEFGKVQACYEAGPTGLGLAREGQRRGMEVLVVAPSSIPHAPGDRVKTDKRDSLKLLRLLAAGQLHFVFVPSIADENLRNLVRAIDALREDTMRARHRLSKFLLRCGYHYTSGRAWTSKHAAWLSSLHFEDACAQAAFADYQSAVSFLSARRATLIQTLEAQVPACSYAQTIARLRCFRGVDTLTAAALCAELYGFERFPRPDKLAGFLGIVPSERSTGESRRQGGITKAGPSHARRLLIEAAQHYSRQPRVRDELARRQQGQDPRVIEIAWRAQRRLHARYEQLHVQRRKPRAKVTVAVARELVCFMWEAARLN